MARTKGIKLNSREIQTYLDGGHGVREQLRERAEQVASAARDGAPVLSGTYRDSIEITEDRTDRLVVRVVADVPYAGAVEAATGNLARALDAGR